MTRKIGIFIYDQVEVLDFAGPFEVYVTASRVKLKKMPGAEVPFEVFTVAAQKKAVTARGGLMVTPTYGFGGHPMPDVVIIPGGVIDGIESDPAILDWLKSVDRNSEITASVCTGAFLLAKAGLLDDMPATTHWEDQADLKAMYPGIHVLKGKRWVDNGKVVTAGGISAGISMSLHLVARLEDEGLAVATARQMEFDWNPE